MLYPQNDDRIVAIDSVTSIHPMYKNQKSFHVSPTTFWPAEKRPYSMNLFICKGSCQTNYLKIYRIDLRQIFNTGRAMAVGDHAVFN